MATAAPALILSCFLYCCFCRIKYPMLAGTQPVADADGITGHAAFGKMFVGIPLAHGFSFNARIANKGARIVLGEQSAMSIRSFSASATAVSAASRASA